jgi:integrase
MAKRRAPNNQGNIKHRDDGRWEGRLVLPNGKRRSVYAKSQKEVVQRLSQLRRDIEVGLSPESDKQTVEQFLLFWLETHALRVRGSSIRKYELYVREYIIPYLGSVCLNKLTPQRVQAWVTEMLAAGVSAYSVRYAYYRLKQAMNFAVNLEMIMRNPATKIQLPRSQRRSYVTWTEEQVRTFLSSVRGHRYELIFMLMISTGMRIGEITALRWEAIDLEQGMLSVLRTQTLTRQNKKTVGDPKTGSSQRKIYLMKQVVEALSEFRQIQQERRKTFSEKDYLFLDSLGNMVSNACIYIAFVVATRRAGLPRIRQHDMRHTAATLLLRRGVNVKVVSQMLGHANTSMTMNVYAHVLDEMKREAADMMETLFGDDME